MSDTFRSNCKAPYVFKVKPQRFYLHNEIKIRRTLPISLTIQDVINSLKEEYLENTGVDITFQKDFEKQLKKGEKEEIKQESRKKLKEEYQYLLDLVRKLEGK